MLVNSMGIKHLFPGKTDKIVLTIGNFDGFHQGHQKMLSEIKKSTPADCKLVVMTFHPHPRKILGILSKGFLVSSYHDRNKMLLDYGVDAVVEIPFSRDLSNLSPEMFIERYILIDPRVSNVYIGHDFSFGANKKGDYSFLKSYFANKGIGIFQCEMFEFNGGKVSSSEIRGYLSSGNVEMASKLLTRPFCLQGNVIKGKGRGHLIGYPTANIAYDEDLISPSKGVYVTKTSFRSILYDSITNIGVNPTFESSEKINIETHLFDFNTMIYGEEIKVYFLAHVRNEKKFSSANELIEQIKLDSKLAREHHEKNRPH